MSELGRSVVRRWIAVLAASSAIAAATPSCSLLAPSDEEAMAGTDKGDASAGAGADASATDATSNPDAGAKAETGSTVCPGCQVACNRGQCSACFLNGAACKSSTECCGGVCNPQGTCEASAGSCAADNSSCTTAPDSCCPGLTCSSERDSRCEACRNGDENCKADTDCCSANCNGTRCAACVATGSSGCTRPRQCCSGICNAGTCG